jgi:hypothetical protein
MSQSGCAVVSTPLRIRVGHRHLRRGLGGEDLGSIPMAARTARPLLRLARRDVQYAPLAVITFSKYEALKFLRTHIQVPAHPQSHIPSRARSAPLRRRPHQTTKPPPPLTQPLSLMTWVGGGSGPRLPAVAPAQGGTRGSERDCARGALHDIRTSH